MYIEFPVTPPIRSCLYWSWVKKIAESLRDHPEEVKVILWNDRFRTSSIDELLGDIDNISNGGTSTVSLCQELMKLREGFRLVLVTDGEVAPRQAVDVHLMMSSSSVIPWVDVDAYMINTRIELDVSVVMPFIGRRTYRATLVDNDREVVKSAAISDASAAISAVTGIADFNAISEDLLARLVADTAFSDDDTARTALLNLQQRLLKYATESSHVQITIDRPSVLAAAEAFYTCSPLTFVPKIQQMLSLFSRSATTASNLSRQRFTQTTGDSQAVAANMLLNEADDNTESFECPITYNHDVPALTFRESSCGIFDIFPPSFVDKCKRNPFIALGNKAFSGALIAAFDGVLGTHTLR